MPVDFVVEHVLPRPTGNTDPRFLGWVHGGGDDLGIIAAMVGAAMNANTGGRDHGAVHGEQTVLSWMRTIFGFPEGAVASFVQGTSEANLAPLAVARTAIRPTSDDADPDPRAEVLYVSPATHDSVRKVARLLCFGVISVVPDVPGDAGRMDPNALSSMIESDRGYGRSPVAIVGTAGTIDGGACDDPRALRAVADAHRVWLHVDGAFGAWLRIAPAPFDQPVGWDRRGGQSRAEPAIPGAFGPSQPAGEEHSSDWRGNRSVRSAGRYIPVFRGQLEFVVLGDDEQDNVVLCSPVPGPRSAHLGVDAIDGELREGRRTSRGQSRLCYRRSERMVDALFRHAS